MSQKMSSSRTPPTTSKTMVVVPIDTPRCERMEGRVPSTKGYAERRRRGCQVNSLRIGHLPRRAEEKAEQQAGEEEGHHAAAADHAQDRRIEEHHAQRVGVAEE